MSGGLPRSLADRLNAASVTLVFNPEYPAPEVFGSLPLGVVLPSATDAKDLATGELAFWDAGEGRWFPVRANLRTTDGYKFRHPSQPPKAPTVHLNGTSYDGLFRPLAEAGGKIRAAIKAMEECAPHGRDYYLQGDSALAVATSEHLSRVARLQSVLSELQALAEAVANQGDVAYRGNPRVNEAAALALQVWAFRNLAVNAALKESLPDGGWSVLLVLPDGSRRVLDGSPVSLAVAHDPRDVSPRPVCFGLVGDTGPAGENDFFFKVRLSSHDVIAFLAEVPVSCLVDGASPSVYDVLDGRLVLVF